VQIRFEVAVGAFDSYCSEVQLVNGEHWISLVAVGGETSYCEESQVAGPHSRSDVEVGATASICVPAAQMVRLVQTRFEVVVGDTV
jgi:hypothetical protein